MRLAILLPALLLTQAAWGIDCAGLKGIRLPSTTLTTAEIVPGGRYQPLYGDAIEEVPAFCRVAGVIAPSEDSRIRFEVWLPAAEWNGKYLGAGNGGFAGSIDYRALGGNLKRGYASAATDTGHEAEGEDASWAYRHPQKVIDFGYRAIHLTTMNAKAIVTALYGRSPQHAYFDSCSNGGREALMEAERFPDDFDGILAGAPAYDWTHLVAGGVGATQMLLGNPAAYISGTKLPAITAAVKTACDALDGARDGVVSDPLRCHFDPSVLRCTGAESRSCLTEPQLTALSRLYYGPHQTPGLVPGSEAAWAIG